MKNYTVTWRRTVVVRVFIYSVCYCYCWLHFYTLVYFFFLFVCTFCVHLFNYTIYVFRRFSVVGAYFIYTYMYINYTLDSTQIHFLPCINRNIIKLARLKQQRRDSQTPSIGEIAAAQERIEFSSHYCKICIWRKTSSSSSSSLSVWSQKHVNVISIESRQQ